MLEIKILSKCSNCRFYTVEENNNVCTLYCKYLRKKIDLMKPTFCKTKNLVDKNELLNKVIKILKTKTNVVYMDNCSCGYCNIVNKIEALRGE